MTSRSVLISNPAIARTGTTRPRLLIAAALLLGAHTLPVHAQVGGPWQVIDNDANKQLEKTNSKLDAIDKKLKSMQTLGSYKQLGDRAADPGVPLASQALTEGIEACNNVTENQRDVCREIIKTRNAQMDYMTVMYKLASQTRNQQLTDIQDERRRIAATDYGKLQDNTNKLIALQTQMEIDRQQMQAAMYAYDTRLAYLRESQAKSASNMLAGKSENSGLIGDFLKEIGGSLITGAALKAALEAQRSDRPAGMRTLDATKGWSPL